MWRARLPWGRASRTGSPPTRWPWPVFPPTRPSPPAPDSSMPARTNKPSISVSSSVADTWNFGTDSDPDPRIHILLTNGSESGCVSGSCYFRQWPSRSQQKSFFSFTFWRYIYIIFKRKKNHKEVRNSRNQCFSYYFSLLIEGSRSLPLTNGSGSGRSQTCGSSGSATLVSI